MNLLRDINSILEYGRKTTTYKFATLLSIFDYVFEFPSEPSQNHFHFIPVMYLAKRFLIYYYPFSFYPDIYQGGSSGSEPVIIKKIREFYERYFSSAPPSNPPLYYSQIKSMKEKGIAYINRWFESLEELPKDIIRLLKHIRYKILQQPLQYLHNVNDEQIRFFGLYNKKVSFVHSYDSHLKEGMKTRFDGKNLKWNDLLKMEDTFIVIDELVYRELARLRLWGRDVVTKNWCHFIAKGPKMPKKDTKWRKVSALELFDIFDFVYKLEIDRDPILIKNYRDLYWRLDLKKCFYTGNVFRSKNNIHLDHFLPWSYYPVSRFWNLVPCSEKINLQKSNFLPSWDDKIENSMNEHVNRCVVKREEERMIYNDLYYFYRVIHKDQSDIASKDNSEISQEVLEHVKVDLKDLHSITPGKCFSAM
ncbi:MAG: HNH endonuclease domain-containing protein [Promethearchaeota archaeon]